ncbi:MAG TPA: S66 peptidase family protein [Beutenbergiaceae bacterium]|nr:S66 peptidase family protein [Beutenbergiaceae bacterium]
MSLQFPAPLRPGDRIAVTAPSAGVPKDLMPRLDFAAEWLRERGFEVVLGQCLRAESFVSAGRAERAAELTDMLTDPAVHAVVPPWGGEMATDLLGALDWDRISAARPRWLVGFSDLSTLMVPLTLITGWATLHGLNLLETPYRPVDGVRHWLDVAGATEPITQRSPGRYRSGGFDRWQDDPTITDYTLDATGSWSSLRESLRDGDVDARGVLIGGCIEMLSPLGGSKYADIPAFARNHAPGGLILYLEAAEHDAFTIARALHGMRHAGWFDHANAVLIGRPAAPDSPGLSQREAVADALGTLDVPVILDVECGHVPPYLPLVNGAETRVLMTAGRREITQRW